MTHRRLLLSAAMISLLMSCLLQAGCGSVVLFSTEEEIRMGAEAAPELEKQFGGRVDNQQLQDYVTQIGQTVAAQSERDMPYEYTLVNSDVPNAFALPGGKIYITVGLMSRMTNERQLAAVLGHETGHVAMRHNMKNLQRQMGVSILAQAAGAFFEGTAGQVAEGATKVAGGVANLRYSRDDEYEADQVGLDYVQRAGYNPWGMVELLTVLKNLSDSEPGRFTEMFQTHPLSSKRVAEAEEMIQTDGKLRGYAKDAPDPHAQRFLRMRALLPKPKPETTPKVAAE